MASNKSLTSVDEGESNRGLNCLLRYCAVISLLPGTSSFDRP